MSVKINKKISILWKLGMSAFMEANKKVLVSEPRRIGASDSAIRKMIANTEEQKVLMPSIIAEDPNSSNWSKSIKNYWNSISVDIVVGGKDLEAGFDYDIETTNEKTSTNIKELIKKTTYTKENKTVVPIKDSVTLAKYCEAKVPEDEKYKYGFPIVIEDYILYRYCLVYRDVANNAKDINKSAHIRFYIFSEAEASKNKKTLHDTNRKAMALYLDVIKDKEKLDSILYLMGRGNQIINMKDDIDKQMLLEEVYKSTPAKFIKVCGDQKLGLKGDIEKFIASGILKRFPGSSMIVDSNDAAEIVGNNIDEAVTYFSSDIKKAKISEYYSRYKGLLKTDKIE